MDKDNITKFDTAISDKPLKRKSQAYEIWRRLCKNKGAIVGLAIFALLVLAALSSVFIFDYEADVIRINVPNSFHPPSLEYPFGTDELGRNILARVAYGARVSLSIGFTVTFFAILIGITLGSIAGYYGGKLENVIMRIMDVFLAIPAMLLAICIVAALGASTTNMMIALVISAVPGYSRVMRAPVLAVRDIEYVEAARAIGARNSTIIIKHVLPNCLAPMIVQTAIGVAVAILNVAALSFLGLGVQPPTPEWGSMLAASRDFIRDYSYMAFFPGAAIMLTILSLNLLGDGLRDALDPRLK